MNIVFELSKEHATLPVDEIVSCLNAEKISFTITDQNQNVVVINTTASVSKIKHLSTRLSHSFYVNELIFSCTHCLKQVQKYAVQHPITEPGSVAIYYKNRSKQNKSQQILSLLATIYAKNRVVDLQSADIKIRAIITDDTIYVAKVLYQINRSAFEQRKVQYRPFFSPITLHPKLACSLVNLSRVSKDETLFDPFCGTGGILLEAGLLGIHCIGSDIEDKMIQGCKATLDFYHVKNYYLFQSDIGDIFSKIDTVVDAVVTDFPYARSTTTKGEDVAELYRRSFTVISSVLKKDGYAVVGVFDKNLVCVDTLNLSIVNIYEFKVHRSMIRYFFVFKKN